MSASAGGRRVDLRVVVDECQILPLLCGEAILHFGPSSSCAIFSIRTIVRVNRFEGNRGHGIVPTMSDSGSALPQVGSTLADFELPDTQNRLRHLRELVRGGAAVTVFYRGHW